MKRALGFRVKGHSTYYKYACNSNWKHHTSLLQSHASAAMISKLKFFVWGEHEMWLSATYTIDDVYMILEACIPATSTKPYASIRINTDEIVPVIKGRTGQFGNLDVCDTNFMDLISVSNVKNSNSGQDVTRVPSKPTILLNRHDFYKLGQTALNILLELQDDST